MSLRRMMFFRLGNRHVHLPKLLGSFLIVVGLLLFLSSVASIFNSADNAAYLNRCLANASGPAEFSACQSVATAAGIVARPDQSKLSGEQWAELLLKPIAMLFFWAVVFVLGLILYLSGKLVIPVEESVREFTVKDKPWRRKKK
ncbi:MAG: hypothetical protein V1847_00165 [Candidatus Diapherotrites archaeon]